MNERTDAWMGRPDGDAPPRLALRPREAAQSLGISERTLWGLTADGAIPFFKLGRLTLYPVDGLREWLAEKAQKAKKAE